MPRRLLHSLLLLCIAVFGAAVWGSIDCGSRLAETGLSAEEATRLRHLIYFHFGVAQLALLAGVLLLRHRHRRWKRYYLLISYNEQGMDINPPGIRMPRCHVYRCHLGNLQQAALPPADAPVLVYPMFMLSGASSGRKLVQLLGETYRARGSRTPRLYYQPVLGASPWLPEAAAAHLCPMLGQPGTGILVVAHGSTLPEPPPEPALFCRRLRELLPGVEVALGYFQQQPEAAECLASMQAQHVLLLPFLLTEGLHTRRDLPTPEQAAACGKILTRLPVVTSLLREQEADTSPPAV